MKKTNNIANEETFKDFQVALDSFQPDLLEKKVTKPLEIYIYYTKIDKLYVWLKNAYNANLQSVENEMRATLGHMSEYEQDRDNLQKAYGHIRRMGIDVLKILCNGFEQEFEEWIITHAAFDYNSHDNLYMPQYVKMYNEAHNQYLYAQQKENLGSNRNNNIIGEYYKAAELYGVLYQYHLNGRREKIHKHYVVMIWQRRLWVLATSVVAVISVIGYIISQQ